MQEGCVHKAQAIVFLIPCAWPLHALCLVIFGGLNNSQTPNYKARAQATVCATFYVLMETMVICHVGISYTTSVLSRQILMCFAFT